MDFYQKVKNKMNILIITPEQYRGDVVHFTDRVFNASNESVFSRITQCDECIMITDISVLLPLANVDTDRNCRTVANYYVSYSKKNAYNLEITRNIQYIEQDILKQYGRTFDLINKHMCLNLSESLMRGKIKIANCGSNNIGGGGGGDNSEGRDDYDYDDIDQRLDNIVHECDNDHDVTSDKTDDFQSQQQQQQRRISNIILKISGIWETENEYGLTYKYYF